MINSIIGGFGWVDFAGLAASNVRLQPDVWLHCPFTPFDYSCTKWLVKNKAVYAPFTFEEILMIAINGVGGSRGITSREHFCHIHFISNHLVMTFQARIFRWYFYFSRRVATISERTTMYSILSRHARWIEFQMPTPRRTFWFFFHFFFHFFLHFWFLMTHFPSQATSISLSKRKSTFDPASVAW